MTQTTETQSASFRGNPLCQAQTDKTTLKQQRFELFTCLDLADCNS